MTHKELAAKLELYAIEARCLGIEHDRSQLEIDDVRGRLKDAQRYPCDAFSFWLVASTLFGTGVLIGMTLMHWATR